jgi:hypothetical protein
MAFRAPLLGYNTNVRHKGKLYHIQTEDSGVGHPHVITHLFADGGRIVASKKTGYSDHIGSQNLQETVKKLMQAQHKAMFIALRDGLYDEDGPNDAARDQTGPQPSIEGISVPPPAPSIPPPAPEERHAAPERTSLYQGTRAAGKVAETPPTPPPAAAQRSAPRSIFGGDLLSEKSLDEVILSYLATDEPDPKR